MERFIVQGGRPIHGEARPAGNKNEALPCLAACLLASQPVALANLPDVSDVRTMIRLLEDVGCEVARRGSLAIEVRAVGSGEPSFDLVRQIRGSFLLAGPLLARRGEVHLPTPGGDRIGRRRIDTHLLAFRKLGAEVEVRERKYVLKAPDGLVGADIFLDEASVMGTENAIMAAAGARGTTRIANAASEPHVQGLCRLLTAMGAEIRGIGSNRLEIRGAEALGGAVHSIGPDHIEVGSLLGLAAVTGGELTIRDAGVENLSRIRLGFERLGLRLEVEGDEIRLGAGQSLMVVDDSDGAVPTLDDAPWPGFPADLISIMIVVATQARGTILIHEKMFESRLFFVDRLQRMGARIILCDPHRAVVLGPTPLVGAQITSPDIRAGMALLIAALAAEGESVIQNVGQIDRGYERIDERLRALGADIVRTAE
ncbi:MAG TPA: UDP-N-acetylglucosamine 1-carboxyvinyltransferase [Gemmatimonadota bacterium]|nr:UDP-N-acetylglucosamine 1-carboxyvinyltransferase [Gemmatimonadota bacterium]